MWITKHNRTEDDGHLQWELLNWLEEHALKKFGICLLEDFSVNLLMSDEVIDHVILCANGNKISTIDDIMRETGWTNQAC